MLGTLRQGDRVFIDPVPLAGVARGDVVAFRPSGERAGGDPLVHRVIAIGPGGLITRGDNNLASDSLPVVRDNLLGRVARIERDGSLRPILGGRWGLVRARLLRWRIYARALAMRLGRGPYRWLRRSGLARQVWHPTIRQVRVASENGPLIKYVVGDRTVARWWPEAARFECPPPYDLIILRPHCDS